LRREYYVCFGEADEIRKFPVEEGNITHLVYSFIFATVNGNITSFIGVDPEGDAKLNIGESFKEALIALSDLKRKHPNLKTKIAIGGGGADTNPLKYQETVIRGVMKDSVKQERMISAMVELVKNYDLDGIDLDFEHPRDEDDINLLVILARRLRSEFDKIRPGLEISCAIAGTDEQIDLYASRREDFDSCGMVWNIMNYDYDYATGGILCVNAPFERVGDSARYSLVESTQRLLLKGFEKKRINIGVPFYGRYFEIEAGCKELAFGQTHYTERRDMVYNAIPKEAIEGRDGWEKVWDDTAKINISLYRGTDGCIEKIYTFDSVKTLEIKRDYAKELDLLGVMVWQICQDTPEWELVRTLAE